MDLIILLELAVVAIIIVIQIMVALRNNDAVKRFAHLFPRIQDLQLTYTELEEEDQPSGAVRNSIRLLEDNPRFSPTFRGILANTNAYLTRNRGVAEPETLKEITGEPVTSQETSIESNLTLPLYIGLLCTFLGVIIGLVKISIVGVSDAAIQSFIGGVLIGMIGSASGLALTVRSNYRFKEGKAMLDKRQYEYLSFLRAQILPILNKDTEAPMSGLRKNLAAFNEGFAQYQQHMNESLSETLGLFGELKDVFKQIRTIENGLAGMGQVIQANDGLVEKQVDAIDAYARKAEALSRKLNRHCAHMDKQLETMVVENLRAMDTNVQSAYQRMDQYMANGNGNGNGHHTQALVRTTAPYTDMGQIRTELETLQEISLQIHQGLMEQTTQENHAHQEVSDQFKQLNNRFAQMVSAQESSVLNAPEFRFFLYAGLAAFVVGIVGGVMFLVNSFAI